MTDVEHCLATVWLDHGEDADAYQCELPIAHNGDGSPHRNEWRDTDGLHVLAEWTAYDGVCEYPRSPGAIRTWMQERLIRRLIPQLRIFSVLAPAPEGPMGAAVSFRPMAPLGLPVPTLREASE